MAHEQFEDALPLYSVGDPDPAERQALEAHLRAGCATCRTELQQYQDVLGLLAYRVPPSEAPAALKARVLEAVLPRSSPSTGRDPSHTMPDPATAETRPPLLSWLSPPAFVLLLGVVLVGAALYALSLRLQVSTARSQLQQTTAALQQEASRSTSLQQQVAEQERLLAGLRDEARRRSGDVESLRAALSQHEDELNHARLQLAQREQDTTSLRKTLAQRDELLTFLRSPTVTVISLSGLQQAKSAGALLLFDSARKKAFFYAFNLPPLPTGKTYQLWAIVEKPVSAGTFDPDVGRKGRLVIPRLPDLARITKFAVSVEPAGGRPQPTGDIYLLGQV